MIRLEQAALIRIPKLGILDNPYHIYGPKKYILFGERKILQTINLPGRMVLSNATIDFGDREVESCTKYNVVMFDDRTFFGVCPVDEVSPNVWECSVDHYHMRGVVT